MAPRPEAAAACGGFSESFADFGDQGHVPKLSPSVQGLGYFFPDHSPDCVGMGGQSIFDEPFHHARRKLAANGNDV